MPINTRNTFIPILILILVTFSTTSFSQTEQISTWRFAENIGLRGVQFSYYDFKAIGKTSKQLLALSREAKPINNQFNPAMLNETNISDALLNHQFLPLNRYRTLNISAVLLPFRRAKLRLFRKTEWQIGLSYSSVNSNSEVYYEPHPDSSIVASFNFSMKDISIANSLLFETKALGRVKLYAGPSINLSISPNFSHTYLETKYTSHRRFNYQSHTKEVMNPLLIPSISYSLGLRAGVKFSLGCRLNLFAEADFQNRWLQYDGFNLSYHFIGYGMGIRYKFVRPDENGDPPAEMNENNLFW